MSGELRLEGNGAGLVRERALAMRIQAALERLYLLDRVADVGDFVCSARDGEREALLLRVADDDALEVSVHLPPLEAQSPQPQERGAHLDTICQIIEGVSHFVYVVERARLGRGATQLELEVQAEVDKWVVLAASMRAFDADGSATLRTRLYERVAYAHDPDTELGERYRVANDVANRFVRRLEREYVGSARFGDLRAALRRFFHVGQEEKLRLGRAA
jgi:hypothetical protein